MKLKIVLTTMLTIVLSVAAISAQNKTADFTGNWTLDASKSKLDERMRVESMTWNVTQTDKELKIETKTKRAPRPEGEMSAGGGQGGGERRGGMGRGGFGGDGTSVYTLDGKETKSEQETPMGKIPVAYKASLEKDGKLKLTSTRSISGPMGEMTITTKETWQLSEDGKTLTVKRESETPRGTQTSEMVFTKG